MHLCTQIGDRLTIKKTVPLKIDNLHLDTKAILLVDKTLCTWLCSQLKVIVNVFRMYCLNYVMLMSIKLHITLHFYLSGIAKEKGA